MRLFLALLFLNATVCCGVVERRTLDSESGFIKRRCCEKPAGLHQHRESDSVGVKNPNGIDTSLIKSSLAFRSIIDEIIGWWLGPPDNCYFERVYSHGRRC